MGSLAKGSLVFVWLGQLPDSRMGWDWEQFYQDCLPSPPSGEIRLNVGA